MMRLLYPKRGFVSVVRTMQECEKHGKHQVGEAERVEVLVYEIEGREHCTYLEEVVVSVEGMPHGSAN